MIIVHHKKKNKNYFLKLVVALGQAIYGHHTQKSSKSRVKFIQNTRILLRRLTSHTKLLNKKQIFQCKVSRHQLQCSIQHLFFLTKSKLHGSLFSSKSTIKKLKNCWIPKRVLQTLLIRFLKKKRRSLASDSMNQ